MECLRGSRLAGDRPICGPRVPGETPGSFASSEGRSQVRRFCTVLAAIGFAAAIAAASGSSAKYSSDNPVKINVMGEWAHPDDDTSIIGPCGVWHQQFNVRCGIIMITRGEGGGNAVGQ